jgi:hypothetical protein
MLVSVKTVEISHLHCFALEPHGMMMSDFEDAIIIKFVTLWCGTRLPPTAPGAIDGARLARTM